MLERLGYKPNATGRFRLADGNVTDRPIGDVVLQVGSEIHHVVCIFGEEGSDMILGATTLESFRLAVYPVNETVTPVISNRLSMTPVNALEEGD